jgi:hypothetical protein
MITEILEFALSLFRTQDNPPLSLFSPSIPLMIYKRYTCDVKML